MKLLGFAASNSKNSINKQLVNYACTRVDNADVDIIDLNDYSMPIYSEDLEQAEGIPALAYALREKIASADALIISFAEHNGSYSAAYKNIFDWMSRVDRNVYQAKPCVLLATSPGQGGANHVLQAAINSAPHFAMEVKGHLSVPSFYQNFDSENGSLKHEDLSAQLDQILIALNP